jgi:hypothetical protein
MKGNMPTDFSPPSPEAMEAAVQLLGRVPKTWAAVPELSHLESQGLGLLVAGGLVERRLSMRLRAVGDKRAVAIRFRFTGQAGLAQAVEPALAEAWALWEAAWKAGRKVYVEPSEGEGEWRLTDQGELAEKCRVGDLDDVRYLRDFLRTPGVPGVCPLPAPLPPFLAGTARFVVNGEGHAERVEVVNADSETLSVRVANLEEVSGPLGDIARIVEARFGRLAEEGQPRGQAECGGGRRGPAPLPMKDALRYVGLLRKWADVQEADQGKPKGQRVTKGKFALANHTTAPDLKAAQSWYNRQRAVHAFPADPRELEDAVLKRLFPR